MFMKHRLRRQKPRPKSRRRSEPKILADSQGALDAAVNEPGGVLVRGGEPDRPLVIRDRFAVTPVVADDSHVLLTARDPANPPDAHVVGDNSVVTALDNSRVTCSGNSVVRAKDHAKVSMYRGRLVAGDQTRCTLSGSSEGMLWGRARCRLRNSATAVCRENARAYLYHNAHADVYGSAKAWLKEPTATMRCIDI